MTLPEAVLFDFDGVLVDSESYHRRMWASAFETLFASSIPDYHTADLTGRASHEIAAVITDMAGVPHMAGELYQTRIRIMSQSSDAPDPAPGARACTDALSARGVPYVVVSNAPSVYVAGACSSLGFVPEMTFGVDDYGGRHKPDPWPYVNAARQLSFRDGQFANLLVVEDSEPGVRAGVAAGIPVLGLARNGSPETLLAGGARAVIQDLSQIDTFLNFS